jgi:N-carbamoyl-L-amino-acid hydrolase
MHLRRDAGHAAGRLICFVRDLALAIGGGQVGTTGSLRFSPNLINVIPGEAVVTVDLRNTDEGLLRTAEKRLAEFLADLAREEDLAIRTRRLCRFEPVRFDEGVVRSIEAAAEGLGVRVRRMTSGAGQDAQMLARICPAAMIFVPSIGGVSHNPAEDTRPEHLELGANVLLRTLLGLAE